MTDTNNEPRNTAFEELKRKTPDVKAIATVWRGTPEYFAWMDTYLSQETEHTHLVENEKVATFYRDLTDSEKEATVEEKVPEPSKYFEELSVTHEHSNEQNTHKMTHVKLANPRWERVGNRFALVEYVLVDQFLMNVPAGEDEPGFTYRNTSVLVSDEEAGDYEKDGAAPIYTSPGWLDVWQAMWALGEIPVQDDNDNDKTGIKE